MNKLLKMMLAAAVVVGLSTTVSSASAAKGQKLFSKFLKGPCGMTGAKIAGAHTQDEWEAIHSAGKLKDEILNICPKATGKPVKDSFMDHYFDFFYNYASDSGNVPSC
jgi:hypothetical protein